MESSTPRVIGSVITETLAELDILGARQGVLGLLNDDLRRELETVLPSAWVSMAANLALYEATHTFLGSLKAHELWRNQQVRLLKRGLLKGLYEGVERVTGISVENLAKHSGRWWSFGAHNCGELTPIFVARGELIARFSGLPGFLAESTIFSAAMRAKVEGVIVAAGRTAQVDLIERDPAKGLLTFRATWDP